MTRGDHSLRVRELGASTILFATLMVSLLAIGAFVFDWGALLHERRQIQNGVDAAALAVAEDCAYDTDECESSGEGVAKGLVDPNAEDDVTALDSVAIDVEGHEVTVAGSSLDQEDRPIVRFFFGRLLTDDEGKTVEATATAEWGGIGAASSVPLSFHRCEWDDATDLGTDLPSDTLTINFHNSGPASCAGGPANQNRPGNWGWLDIVAPCVAETTAGGIFEGNTGNPPPGNPNIDCSPDDFPIGEPILFPIFDEATGQGNNVEYHVIGYAAFELEAYKLHSSPEWREPNGYRCPGSQGNQANCITGRFVAFVDLDAALDPDPDVDFGARAVELVE